MSGGGSPSQQTVTNQTVLPQWVQDAATQNIAQANAVASTPYQAYTGQTVAPLTADQQAASDYARGTLGDATNTINAAGNSITAANLPSTAQSLLNPYLGAVEQPALAAIAQQGAIDQNDLASKAAGAGAFGGTRFGIESAIQASQTAQKAGQTSAQIRSQGWDQAVSTALASAQQQGALASAGQAAGLSGASALSAAGLQEQQQQQSLLSSDAQQWLDEQQYPAQMLALRESSLQATPYSTTQTSSQPINKANPAMSAAGGALSGAAAGSMILPGWGTAAGALIGGVGSYLGSR
jgi:hypothetical protein